MFENAGLILPKINCDVELSDLVNIEPLNNYDLNKMFGVNFSTIITTTNRCK